MADLRQRLTRLQTKYRRRDQMISLCSEMYMMKRERKSGFLGTSSAAWREKVAAEYWESSNKPHNVVDIMTAVLSGHKPQYQCLVPGNIDSTVPSRAEHFIDGVWRLNSRRQQRDLNREFVFRLVRDGACGLRIYWMPNPPKAPTGVMEGEVQAQPQVRTELPFMDQKAPSMGPPQPYQPYQPYQPAQPPQQQQNTTQVENPDNPKASPWVVQLHNHNTFPICIDVVDIANLYPGQPGAYGKPFQEIFYVQRRTPGEVIDEWSNKSNIDLSIITKGLKPGEYDNLVDEYIEWWGQDYSGVVWYAIAFRDHWLVEPRPTQYPYLPFVIGSFKRVGNTRGDGLENLPFLYPIFHSIDKLEYVKSRAFRMIDMYTNMNPYHSGESPISGVDATWGKIIELNSKEDIRFPAWPGNPPDVHRELQQLEETIAEGSFSQAMFGQVSTRVSGYALSQVIGADTLRTDLPRSNLELALGSAADLIFGLMSVFSPNTHLAVTSEIKHRKLAAMLSGNETKALVIEALVKPKQTNDEVRLATLGAQMAASPNPPVSMRYILEHYFGVNQPEEEINRRLDEETMKEPVIRLMALVEVLKENESPYAPILEKQLSIAMQQQQQQQQGQSQPGMGGGMTQALEGNPPVIPPSGNPSEEVGMTPSSILHGGPRE